MTPRSTVLATWILRELEPAPSPTWALSIVIDGTAYDLFEVVAETKADAIDHVVARLRERLK